MRHAIRTWSAVCSVAPHSQFGEGGRPHLCMDERNRPIPILKRLSLTQAAQDKPVPIGLAPVLGTKTRSLEAFLQYSAFHLWFVHSEARMPSPTRLSKRFRPAGINGRLDLNLSWQASKAHLKGRTRYGQGPEIHGEPRRVLLPVGAAQLAKCLRVWVGGLLEWDTGIQ